MLRADPARAAAEGLRPLPADGRARDRRRGRLGDAALRRRARAAGRQEVCDALEIPLEWLPTRVRVDGGGRRRRPGGRRARRRDRPARARLGRARHLGRRLRGAARATRPTPQARVHVFCHAVPGTWHAMGVMLVGRRLASPGSRELLGRGLRDARRGGGALGARRRGAAVRPVPRRRAHAARRSGRARRVHRALAPPRPRRARARDDGRRRLRPARLARAAARARRRRRGRPRLAAAAARSAALDADRRLGARPAARADASARRARRSARRCSPASREGVFADAAEAVARCVRVARADRARPRLGGDIRRGAMSAIALLYPALRPLETS